MRGKDHLPHHERSKGKEESIMGEFDDMILDAFLEQQLQLVPEPVADSREEAEEFLEDCMAVVCMDLAEVRAYFDETVDASGLSDEDLLDQSEVFVIPDGRYLVVEG